MIACVRRPQPRCGQVASRRTRESSRDQRPFRSPGDWGSTPAGPPNRLLETLSTIAVNRRGPPPMPRAELGIHGLNRWSVKSLEKSEKRGVQAAGNGPSEDSKCWQRVRAVILCIAHVLGLGGLDNSSSSEGATVHSLGASAPGPGDTSKEAFSSPGGATVAPWPSPTVAPIGAWNGERLGPLGDILGLTPPGYELSPLRGWGKHR